MKKTYQEIFDDMQIQEDFKEDIIMQAIRYDKGQAQKRYMRNKLVVATLAVVIMFAFPIFKKYVIHDASWNQYTIKASDDYYNISNNEIEIKDYKTFTENYLFTSNLSIGKVSTDPFKSPLSVVVTGDHIESITYTMDNAKFYQIYEVDEVTERSILQYPYSNYGGDGIDKKENTFPQLAKEGNTIPGDPLLPHWFISNKSCGNQITIPYEEQGTIKGFYGISFQVIDDEIIYSDKEISVFDEEVRAKVENKLIEAIHDSILNIRINYVGGTYTTTQLHFKTDEQNAMQIIEE